MFGNPGLKILTLAFLLLSLICSVSSLTEKVYYVPGNKKQIAFRSSDYPHTKVLHDFVDEVGTDKADVVALEDAGFYSLKVTNVNGSFVDDMWMYHAIPSWLCKFTDEEYLLEPVPTEFVHRRTAVVPCTILGSPQPKFVWEKYNNQTETWTPISDLGLLDSDRYIQSHVLGHLYIKHFSRQDTGRYRCRASNECGARCPSEPRCTQEDVIGDPVDLRLRDAEYMELSKHYFLNPIINQCWDTEGNYYDGSDSRFCSGLRVKSSHIYPFSQYTSINSTATMEAFVDFERLQNDDMDNFRIGSVRWNEYPDIDNFEVIEDYEATSGICIAEIEGFKSFNMKEYYYCAAYYPNELLKEGLRFEFVMKEAPYVGFPRGVAGKRMSRVIAAPYGSRQNLEFTIQISSPGFTQNKVHDKWICQFNAESIANPTTNWHKWCNYNASRSDIVQFTIDYVVFGDAGYYQIIAGNDEGWAIGPPILLLVTGTEPDHGPYVLTELDRTTEKITVRWNRPNYKFPKVPVYEVLCENLDWDEGVKRSYVSGLEWTELTNLRSGALYAITVKLDGGLVADKKEIRTLPVRTEAVVSFTCSSGPTNIWCRWAKPDPSTLHSEKIFYEVEVKDVKRKDKNTTRVYDKEEIELTNLRPYTMYKIKIMACNEKGCAETHNAAPFKTVEELPGEVVFRKPPRAKHFSVFVAMKYPKILPGVLETEVVRYEEEHYRKLKEQKSMDSTVKGELIVHDVVQLVGNGSASSNDTTGLRHLFTTEEFEIEGLSPSTTYWMKFRWKTGAGAGPFSPYIKVKVGRYFDIKKLVIGCGITAFFLIATSIFCLYVKRRWPGLAKVVFQKIRDYINPSYMAPIDPLDAFQMQTEDDPNIVYEFDMTQNDI